VARYGKAYKDRINARLLPESAAVDAVPREVGVRAETLERWRAQALAGASGERGRRGPTLDGGGAA
jgi:transposase-like protein